jgi:hypothetical protein
MANKSGIRFLCAMAFAFLWTLPQALAKGSDIHFHGTVTQVAQETTATGTVTVRAEGVDIPVSVNADTDVVLNGDDVGLPGIQVNDFVKVEGFFSSSGILATEIQILDAVTGSFRLRGNISAVSVTAAGTVIAVLGVPVLVDSGTSLERRGPDGGITFADLVVGLPVDVMGVEKNETLVAVRVKAGTRDDDALRLLFDGTITSVDGGRLEVATDGGGTAVVLMTGDTVVRGTLTVGAAILVKGTLNAQLEVVAARIIQKGQEDTAGPQEGISFFRKAVTLQPVSADIRLSGGAMVDFVGPVSRGEQRVRIGLERGNRGAEYRILVTFGSAAPVDFGAIVTNPGGAGEANFATTPRGNERDLATLLPAGLDVRNITRIQITGAGTVLLEGVF